MRQEFLLYFQRASLLSPCYFSGAPGRAEAMCLEKLDNPDLPESAPPFFPVIYRDAIQAGLCTLADRARSTGRRKEHPLPENARRK
jgi:hypothetical protein